MFPTKARKEFVKNYPLWVVLWVFRSPHLFPAGGKEKRWCGGKSVIFSFVSFSLSRRTHVNYLNYDGWKMVELFVWEMRIW